MMLVYNDKNNSSKMFLITNHLTAVFNCIIFWHYVYWIEDGL